MEKPFTQNSKISILHVKKVMDVFPINNKHAFVYVYESFELRFDNKLENCIPVERFFFLPHIVNQNFWIFILLTLWLNKPITAFQDSGWEWYVEGFLFSACIIIKYVLTITECFSKCTGRLFLITVVIF